jgi:hypothetical protein
MQDIEIIHQKASGYFLSILMQQHWWRRLEGEQYRIFLTGVIGGGEPTPHPPYLPFTSLYCKHSLHPHSP